MRTLLRIGLGVCLWTLGIPGLLIAGGMLVQAQRDGLGFPGPLRFFAFVCSSMGLLYLLYRHIGNHWDAMKATTKSLMTLMCSAIFVGAGWVAWEIREAFVVLFYVVLGIAFLVFFFLGGGKVTDFVGYGPRDRAAERDANLIGISNALDDIKKKL